MDFNTRYPILHGIIGKTTPEDLKKIPPRELPRVIARIAGANRADLRMLHSVTKVGKSIYSWPQLGTAATLCGSVLAYISRQIILGNRAIKSGRYEVNPAAIFETGYHARAAAKRRNRSRKQFLKKLGLS